MSAPRPEDIPVDRELKSTFNTVAETYDRARPGYPEELYDALIELSELPAGGRALEVGCGTGKATVPLAERGYEIVGIELGTDLAAVARRNLAEFENCTVEVGAFETWPLPAVPFDLVFSAAAWHWIDPAVRLDRAAAALRPGGAIAIFGGGHVAGGDTSFFNEMQPCYERFMPGTPKGLRLTDPDTIAPDDWGLGESTRFDPPVFRRWIVIIEYSTATYLDLLRTFSGHIALEESNRVALFECVSDLLESRYGGRVRRATLTELCVARRRN